VPCGVLCIRHHSREKSPTKYADYSDIPKSVSIVAFGNLIIENQYDVGLICHLCSCVVVAFGAPLVNDKTELIGE
jgi:hypothetical protein